MKQIIIVCQTHNKFKGHIHQFCRGCCRGCCLKMSEDCKAFDNKLESKRRKVQISNNT